MSRSNRHGNSACSDHATSRSPLSSPTAERPLVRLPAVSNYDSHENSTPSFAEIGRNYRTTAQPEHASILQDDGMPPFTPLGGQYRSPPPSPSPPPPPLSARPERQVSLRHHDLEGRARRALPNEILHATLSATGRPSSPGPSPASTSDVRLRALALFRDTLARARSRAGTSANFHLPSAPPGFGYGGLAGNLENNTIGHGPLRSTPATANATASHTRHHHRSTPRSIPTRGTRARDPTSPPMLDAHRNQNDVPTSVSNNLAELPRTVPRSGLVASVADTQRGTAGRTRSHNTLPTNVVSLAYFSESPVHHELLQTIIRHFYPAARLRRQPS